MSKSKKEMQKLLHLFLAFYLIREYYFSMLNNSTSNINVEKGLI